MEKFTKNLPTRVLKILLLVGNETLANELSFYKRPSTPNLEAGTFLHF